MNHNIDKLFKDKLGNRHVSPSPKAWNKVQGQLNKNKETNHVLFYKVASVFIFILLSTFAYRQYFIIPGPHETEKPEIADHMPVTTPEQKEEDVAELSLAEENTSMTQEMLLPEKHNEENENIVIDKAEKVQNRTIASKEKKKIIQEPFEPEIPIDIEYVIAEKEAIKKDDQPVQSPLGITITYKKGNRSQRTVAIAAPAETETTAIRKLLKMAKEIRVSDLSLAEIRDSKEDLFSKELIKLRN